MRELMRIREKVQEIESRSFLALFLNSDQPIKSTAFKRRPIMKGDVASGAGDQPQGVFINLPNF